APHIVGNVDVAVEEALETVGHISLEPSGIDALGLRCGNTMIAKAEAHQTLKHWVLTHKAHFMVEAMGIRREPRRFQRQSGNRIAFGYVLGQADSVGTGGWSTGTEIVEIGIAK